MTDPQRPPKPRAKIQGLDGKSLHHWSVFKTQTTSRHVRSVRGITRDELALHNKADDYWCALHGHVFDLTDFLPYHPGGTSTVSWSPTVKTMHVHTLLGSKILLPFAGKDISAVFEKYHAWVNYEAILEGYHVGLLRPS